MARKKGLREPATRLKDQRRPGKNSVRVCDLAEGPREREPAPKNYCTVLREIQLFCCIIWGCIHCQRYQKRNTRLQKMRNS